MYTVLIIPSNSMKSFLPYSSLVASAVHEGVLGICEWFENGRSISEAVPDLYKLIEYKQSWRAVVVCSEKLECDTQFKVDEINPFEYVFEDGIADVNGEPVDISPALVRLTHLLTGQFPGYTDVIPEMILEYPEQDEADDVFHAGQKLPQFRYRIQEKDEALIQRENRIKDLKTNWMSRHAFEAAVPSQIMMIKVRESLSEEAQIKQLDTSWKNYKESESSEFWKRCLYSEGSRFLVFDMDSKGKTQIQNRLFALWSIVLILAENKIDSDMIRPQRLYRIDCQMDKGELKTVFQGAVSRLNRAHYTLEKEIRYEQRMKEEGVSKTPEFDVKVEVESSPAGFEGIYLKAKKIKLAEKYTQIDINNWSAYVENSQKDLRGILKAVSRDIDQSAGHARYEKEFLSDEVREISKYTKEDIEDNLNERLHTILKVQKELPALLSAKNNAIELYDKDVRSLIRKRMTKGQVIWICTVITITLLFMFVCSILTPDYEYVAENFIVIMLASGLLALLIMLVYQRYKLIQTMRYYEDIMVDTFDGIHHGSQKIASTLTETVSHIRGASYLRLLEKKRSELHSAFYRKQRKVKTLENFLESISRWNTAMQIGIDMERMDERMNEAEINYIDDINIERMITLDSSKWKHVPVNRSGISVLSPYSFVSRLTIERIEVYDDPVPAADTEVNI